MSTTIADTRRAVGWTVRELAENMGVAPSTVTRMEQSERDDRIQLGTPKRDGPQPPRGDRQQSS
jgi:transcriptional regulator with XRE-family HTH domain